jgi:hypothetical protein
MLFALSLHCHRVRRYSLEVLVWAEVPCTGSILGSNLLLADSLKTERQLELDRKQYELVHEQMASF